MFHRMEGKKTIEILDEFDDAREVVAALAAEYEACEKPDYLQQAMQVWPEPADGTPNSQGKGAPSCCQTAQMLMD